MTTVWEPPILAHWRAEMLLRRRRDGDGEKAEKLLDEAIAGYRTHGVGMYLRHAEKLASSVSV